MKSSKRECSNEHKSFAGLPRDILIAIFLRLPRESVMCCGCVCKSWYSLTQDPLFIKEHKDGKGVGQQFLLYENPNPDVVNFFMLNVDDKEIRRIPLTNLELKDFAVKNNCNGLLCLSHKKHRDPVVIYNPITGESITLPPFRQTLRPIFNHRLTLGFDTISKTYKVIRTFEDHRMVRHYYMIDVGREDTWKRLFLPRGMQSFFISHSTYWNGAIFWTISPRKPSKRCRKCCLLAFDLHVKAFQVINSPSGASSNSFINFPCHASWKSFYVLSLLHMGEYLAMVEYDDSWITLWKVTGEKIGEYSLIFEWRGDTCVKLEKNDLYEVVGRLNGGGFLLQVTAYDKKKRVNFTKFLPGPPACCKALEIPGMNGRLFTTLTNYKWSLVSPSLI